MRQESNATSGKAKAFDPTELADETLLSLFVALLRPYEDENCRLLVWAGVSESAASKFRTLFLEIAQRWLPTEPFERAVDYVCDGYVCDGFEAPIPGLDPWDDFLAEHPELLS